MLRKLLAFTSVVELATGLVLIVDPAIVVALLLGADVAGVGIVVGRCFGIALITLGLACWPARERAESGSPAARAMLVYNALIALYLGFLGGVAHLSGLLLWPAAALHAVVAILLGVAWRRAQRVAA